MKKMKLVALSAVLCLVLGMTVNAEGSSAGGVQVSQETKTATVTKADGTKVENAAVVPVVKESSKAVVKEEAKKALLHRAAIFVLPIDRHVALPQWKES